jgi:hypothetical protein
LKQLFTEVSGFPMLKSSPVKRVRVIRLIACALCIFASHVCADWRAALHDEKSAGKADLRVHGLQVYEARLWSSEAAPDRLSPFALELTHQRKIDKDTLINASLDEMRRVADDDLYRRRSGAWADEMRRSFTDVNLRSLITGRYLPSIGSRLYVDDRLHHEVVDPIFTKLFFAIWLAPQTRYPKLREQLLGLNDSLDQGERQ